MRPGGRERQITRSQPHGRSIPAHPGLMPTRREGPRPTLRLRVATWVRHHVADTNPDQSRSSWDDRDAVTPPDDDSITDRPDHPQG